MANRYTPYYNAKVFNPVEVAYKDPQGGLGYIIGSALGGMWQDDYNKRGADKEIMKMASTPEGQAAFEKMGMQNQVNDMFTEYGGRTNKDGSQEFVSPWANAQTNTPSQQATQPQQASNLIGASSDYQAPVISFSGNTNPNYALGVDPNGNPVMVDPTTNKTIAVNGSLGQLPNYQPSQASPVISASGNTINPSYGEVNSVGTTSPMGPMPTPSDKRLDLIGAKARETVGLPELADKSKFDVQSLAKEYITITDKDGSKVVLSLDNGQGGIKTPEQAVADYQQNGQSMGKFATQEEADQATRNLKNADILTGDIPMNKNLPVRQRIDDYLANKNAVAEAVYPDINRNHVENPAYAPIENAPQAPQQEQSQAPNNLPQEQQNRPTSEIAVNGGIDQSTLQSGIMADAQRGVNGVKQAQTNTNVQQPSQQNAQPQQEAKNAITNQAMVARTPEQKQSFNNAFLSEIAQTKGFSPESLQKLAQTNPKAVDALMANFNQEDILATLKSNMALNHVPLKQQGMVLDAIIPKLAATQKTINQAEGRAYQAMLAQLDPTDYKSALPILNALATVDPASAKTWSTAFATGGQVLKRNWGKQDKADAIKQQRENVLWTHDMQTKWKKDAQDEAYNRAIKLGATPQEAARVAYFGGGGGGKNSTGATKTTNPMEDKLADKKFKLAKDYIADYDKKVADGGQVSDEDKAQNERMKAYVDAYNQAYFGNHENAVKKDDPNTIATFWKNGGGNDVDKAGKKKLAKSMIDNGYSKAEVLKVAGLSENDLKDKRFVDATLAEGAGMIADMYKAYRDGNAQDKYATANNAYATRQNEIKQAVEEVLPDIDNANMQEKESAIRALLQRGFSESEVRHYIK